MNSLECTVQDLQVFFQENASEPVGTACSETQCPLATYFAKKRNLQVRVTGAAIHVSNGSSSWEWRELEEWQRRFSATIDVEFCDNTVCGSEAMDALDKVLEEEKNGDM